MSALGAGRDDRRFLVGQDCGAKIYGAHFDTIMREFEGARSRASLLPRMQHLKAALPSFNMYLASLRADLSVIGFGALRAEMRYRMPRLWGELVMACLNNHGKLLIDRQIPDPEAEKRADQEYERDMQQWNGMSNAQRKKYHRPLPPVKPIYKTITETAGQRATPDFR